MAKRGRPVTPGLGFQQSTKQYRKIVNGRHLSFGTDPEEALARHPFRKETGLIRKRGYRQFCLEENGTTIPMKGNTKAARRNFAAYKAKATARPVSVGNMEFVVNTLAEVGDAYLQWLIKQKKSADRASASKRRFNELTELEGCGDLPLDKLSIGYFKNWYRHCRQKVEVEGRQATRANKRMVIVKAAFTRCQREGWMAVAMPDLN